MSERLINRIKNVWRNDMVDGQSIEAEIHYARERAADEMRVDLLSRALDVKTQWEHYLVKDPFSTKEIDAEYRARLDTINDALKTVRGIAPSVDAHIDVDEFHKSVHESASEQVEGGCIGGFEDEKLRRDLREYVKAGDPESYTAEQLIAKHLLQEIIVARSYYPGEQIDLSQKYATEDSAVAIARHEKAIQTLQPFIGHASDLGYEISNGCGLTTSGRAAEMVEPLDRLATQFVGHSVSMGGGI